MFYNDVLQPNSTIYTGPDPGPDTTFRQSLETLRRIYQANFMKIVINSGTLTNNNAEQHPSPGFLDSCLTAQPGYIDAAQFGPVSPSGFPRFIKAWKVTPVGSSFPMVFVEDSTGAAWPVSVVIP